MKVRVLKDKRKLFLKADHESAGKTATVRGYEFYRLFGKLTFRVMVSVGSRSWAVFGEHELDHRCGDIKLLLNEKKLKEMA